MKKLLLLLLLGFTFTAFSQDPNDFNVNKEGDKAPDFSFQTLDGKKAKLSDFKGKIVLLNFFATW